MSLPLGLKFLRVSYWCPCPVVLFPLQRKNEIYWLVGTNIISNEGDQNMLPPNIPLRHEDYFELKEIEKQQTQEELPFFCLKARHKFPFVQVTHISICKGTFLGRGQDSYQRTT